jgi:hypothetical protein
VQCRPILNRARIDERYVAQGSCGVGRSIDECVQCHALATLRHHSEWMEDRPDEDVLPGHERCDDVDELGQVGNLHDIGVG